MAYQTHQADAHSEIEFQMREYVYLDGQFAEVDRKWPSPPQNNKFSSMISLKSDFEPKVRYLYVFGGISNRLPAVNQLKVTAAADALQWQEMTFKGNQDDLIWQFQFRRFLGLACLEDCPDPRLLVFGGCRKMQQIETWCIVEISHTDREISLLRQLHDRPINNKKASDMMNEQGRGRVEQNQICQDEAYVYALKTGYVNIFDKEKMKWMGREYR